MFWVFPVDKDGFIARLFPTLLVVEMYHSLNIRAVLSNLKELLFVGNICPVTLHIFLSGEDNPALAPPMVNFTHTGYHKSARSAAFGCISGRGIVKEKIW